MSYLNIHEHHPEFIRLPKSGQKCPYTGLSRSALNAIILPSEEDPTPPVKSRVLRKRGNVRGIRLINFDSLMNYINSFDERGESTSAPDENATS